jgi:hypothetical protein
VCGHYWCTAPPSTVSTPISFEDKKDIPPTFLKHEGPLKWLGPKKNVMCIDYSVGKRFLERHHGATVGSSGAFLAAFRYTRTNTSIDVQLMFDDGRIESIET